MVHHQFTLTLYRVEGSAPCYSCSGWISDLRKASNFLKRHCMLHDVAFGCMTIPHKFTLHYKDGAIYKDLEK